MGYLATVWLSLLAQAEPEGPGSGMDRSQLLLIGGLFVFGLFMVFVTQRRVSARQKSGKFRMKKVAQPVSLNREGMGIYHQIYELMAELTDLSRQINGQLDTRLAKLEYLLNKADQAIVDLKGATGASAPVRRSAREGPASVPAELPQSREVLTMAEQGMSAVMIAQKLERPVGEIELILSLSRRREERGDVEP